jgi:glucans biosynthesis protein
MRRRELLPLLAALGLAPAAAGAANDPPPVSAFDAASVRNLARELALKAYQPPDSKLPDELLNLKYSDYQTLRFDKSKALWRGDGGRFTVEFFHRGFLFKDRVTVFEVVDGQARQIPYSSDMFNLDRLQTKPTDDLGFAGFRVHYPLNKPDVQDEVCAFLGASYFRAVARGQGYGLSARGLAIKTGDPGGEEFPLFKSFWLERPGKGSDVMVIHALLDSPSAAASFRFTLRPGAETDMDAEMALYPRVDLAQAGLAPMTIRMAWP